MRVCVAAAAKDDVIDLLAFPRADGRWGIRNHVLVLPLHAAACNAAELVVRHVPSAVTVRHDWQALSNDPDAGRVARTFVGFASHPNVAACIVIGVDEEGAAVAQAAKLRGSDVHVFSLAGCGGTERTVAAAAPVALELTTGAAQMSREPAPTAALVLGLECGASDAWSGVTANPALGAASDRLVAAGGTAILAETSELLGAEHLLARRAATPEIGAAIVEMVARFERDIATFGVDLRGSQPTPGNIAGGLSTIEEKSLGAARKGGNAPVSGVLDYAGRPLSVGLHVMDTPGQDIEQMVGMVAGGANIVAFTTGHGTPTGSPIAPCLKISTTSAAFERVTDVIDLNAGTILDGTETLEEAGIRILERLVAVANGELTATERRRNHEFALSRLASA